MNSIFSIFITINFLLFFFVNLSANNQIEVSSKFLDFPNSKRYNHFNIYNYGEKNAEIEISVKSIETKSHKVVYSSKKDLLLDPKNFILEPGHSRDIKVIKKVQPKNSDQFFIINITDNTPKTDNELEKTKNLTANELHFDIGNNILAIIRPKQLSPKIETTKIDNELIISNVGNTTLHLEHIKQCNKEDCIDYHSIMLYPNSKKIITLKKPKQVITLIQNISGHKKSLSIS